jgi:7-carboxy-7-deazaguanine synthase
MSYAVKELFYTLQGEGVNAGRPAVFCRFSGCNLWTGLELDRSSAVCKFCDTDFVGTNGTGGGRFETAYDLAKAVRSTWPERSSSREKPFVVCTGGEPLLQFDAELVSELHHAGFEIAIETNGTLTPPSNVDWICVSPKGGSQVVLKTGNPQWRLSLQTHKLLGIS